MNEIHSNLISEIRILLISEELEFRVERTIVNELISPNLKKYFQNEFNIDFNIIDVHYNGNCNNIPQIDKTKFVLLELENCQKISNGISTIFFIGENYGKLNPPKQLTIDQFTCVLNFLQSTNDPAWIIFNSKYTKNSKSNNYFLDENIDEEEMYSILYSIYSAIGSGNDAFPLSFKDEYFTSILEKCLKLATTTIAMTSSTQIIQRLTIDSFQPKEPEIIAKNPIYELKKEKYDNLLKFIRRKFIQDNNITYTVSNTTLFAAEKDLNNNSDKLSKIFELCNLVTNKSRLLTKDLRISTNSDIYMQIFTEHLMKIIRDNCKLIFLKKEFSKSLSSKEIISHKINKIISNKTDLSTIINRDREREFTIFNNYLSSTTAKTPGLLYGPIGCGKSTLIIELYNKMDKSSNCLIIFRRCGNTITSSSLQLLLSSITYQINLSFSKSCKPSQASEYAVCVYEFWLSLNKSTTNKPIIILLDDIDKLFPSSHTDMVKWLPHSLPKGVKVLITSSSESFYQGFKRRYDVSNIINIPMIDSREAIKLFNNSIELRKEKIISEILINQANFVLQENSTPLYFNLLSSCIDTVKDPEVLTSDIKSVIKLNILKLEANHPSIFITHILSYLSLCRFGLSFSELVDILSLDNRILSTVEFDILSRNGFRFPSFIVENILQSSSNLLDYIQTNDRLLIKLKHQIYKTTIIEHYQLFQEDGIYFFQTLFDYWISKYENDKLKPIFDKMLDNDDLSTKDSSHMYLKRKITSQPYYTINKLRNISSNDRKLTELTYLLVTYDKPNDLYKLVLFNFEYLFATLYHFGMNHLMSEMYYCRQLNDIKNNVEVELLLVQLRLLSTDVINNAQLLSPELTGRLSHLVGINSLLSYLHQHIDAMAPKVNTIISAIPSYPTIDIENIRVDIGLKCNLILSTLSPDNRFIITIHFQKPSDELIITIWDSRSGTKSQIINLGQIKETKITSMFYVPQKDDLLILKFEDLLNTGFFIVNLEFSSMENIIKLSKKDSIKVEYVSKSHLYLMINNDIQVLTIPSGMKDHNISKLPWPTILSPNDKYLIGPKQPTKKDINENLINFNLRVMNGVSGEMLCQLHLNYNSYYLLANVRNESLFVTTKLHGIIFKYDIGQIAKKDIKRLKHTVQLTLSEQTLNGDIQELITKYSPNIKGNKLHLSVDEKYLLAEYSLSDNVRVVAVWSLGNKSIVFCNQISYSATVSFSTDGQYFSCFVKNEPIRIYNLANGINYNLELDESPDQVYLLRAGSFFMVLSNAIKMVAMKTLIKKNKISENNSEFLPETFQTILQKPKLNSENVVLFSNDENTSNFIYYSLLQNSISVLDVSHTNKSLTEIPSDRYLSPNGENLLLVYGFKLANLVQASKEKDLDTLMLNVDENGKIITNNRDYRKPEIPGENYFIGKPRENKSNKENTDAYSQSIVKIINLNKSQTIFQISLTGEKILKFTDTLLMTFKPDYASFTRNREEAYDIVSIYDIIEGRFVSSLYLEHSVVDSMLLPQDKNKLLVCCGTNGKIIKILGGEYFSTVLLDMDIQYMLKYYDEFARLSVVTKLFVFKDNANTILVQYSWLEHNTNVAKIDKEIHYTKVDIVKKEIVCQFSSLGKIVDVSNDGLMAVDSLLNVYELVKGSILRKLQNSIELTNDISNCNCTSLFSNNGEYLVTLDVVKCNLWVITNNDQGLAVGRALITSTININRSNQLYQMSLGLDGRLAIVYNDQEFKLFIIKMNWKSIPSDQTYKSNTDRIKKLLYNI